jgi:hypothetical protein
MGWLEFISTILGDFAWPIVVVVVVLLFRKQLGQFMKDLRSARLGPDGVELERFDRTLEDANRELEEAIKESRADAPGSKELTEPPEVPPARSFLDEIQEIAKISPEAAIMEAAGRIELVLRRALERQGVQVDPRQGSLRMLAKAAVAAGIISSGEGEAIADLAALRNVVAHRTGRDIDESRALAYAEVARQAIIAVELGVGSTRQDWDGPGAPP